MYYAFQDRENLYLVMDYLSGGDLRYHICRNRRFSEEITRKWGRWFVRDTPLFVVLQQFTEDQLPEFAKDQH